MKDQAKVNEELVNSVFENTMNRHNKTRLSVELSNMGVRKGAIKAMSLADMVALRDRLTANGVENN